MLQVVAGIIERDGRILICRRTERQSHPLQWEFPGGKVEPGETPRDALERELQEELGIGGAQGSEIARYEFEYPGKPRISLIFFAVERFEGEPGNLIFREMRWETPDRLADYDFVEGDIEFLTLHAPWRAAQ
jgi:8-oxo-dGTP diphosphatase